MRRRALAAAWVLLAFLGAYLAVREAMGGVPRGARATAVAQILLVALCLAAHGDARTPSWTWMRPLLPWTFAGAVSLVVAALGAWVLYWGGWPQVLPAWGELVLATGMGAASAAFAACLLRAHSLLARLAGCVWVALCWWPPGPGGTL